MVAALPIRMPISQPIADGGDDVPAAQRRVGLGERECRRHGERVGMQDQLLVDVVHLEGMAGGAVDQHRSQRPTLAPLFQTDATASPPSSSTTSRTFCVQGRGRAVQADAEAIEDAELHPVDHARGNVGQGGVPAAKRARSRGIREERGL